MKTTAAITVALVLAIAALAAHAGDTVKPAEFRDGKPAEFNPVMDLANELLAHIQDAQDKLSRYPGWYPLFRAPDDVAISKLATELAETIDIDARDTSSPLLMNVLVNNEGLGPLDAAAYMNARTVGEAIDVLNTMGAVAHEIAHTVQQRSSTTGY